MNEPTLAAMGGAPAGYDAAAFGRDFKVFREFVRKDAPDIVVLGPGSVGETTGDWGVASGGYALGMKVLPAAELVAAGGADVDAFSYHHYGATSRRCAAMGHQTTAADALSEDWLARTDETLAYYRAVRDAHLPSKHFWNTETADAACGGNPWGGQFLDTFRFLDQLQTRPALHADVVEAGQPQRVAQRTGARSERPGASFPYGPAKRWPRLRRPLRRPASPSLPCLAPTTPPALNRSQRWPKGHSTGPRAASPEKGGVRWPSIGAVVRGAGGPRQVPLVPQ